MSTDIACQLLPPVRISSGETLHSWVQTLIEASHSRTGSTFSSTTPLGWPLRVYGTRPIRSVKPQKTQRFFSLLSTASAFMLPGVVRTRAKDACDIAILTCKVCAIYNNDEERCVTIARHLIRDGATTDSYRMFALLSRLCQSPSVWYTSGPAQKFILRQIKAMDASHSNVWMQHGENNAEPDCVAGTASDLAGADIDVCLLMLYGHILFTSTSYAYSLGRWTSVFPPSSGADYLPMLGRLLLAGPVAGPHKPHD